MATLHLDGTSRALPLALGRSLLDVIVDAAHPIATSCGGQAACGLCRVEVLEGMQHLRPAAPREVEHLGNLRIQRGWRLACQARLIVDGDVRARVPAVVDIAQRKQARWTEQIRQRQRERAATSTARGPASRPRGSRRP